MKQTTLEDLYYGNINPNEICFVRGSEYGKCFDKVTELSKSVCSQLLSCYGIDAKFKVLSIRLSISVATFCVDSFISLFAQQRTIPLQPHTR